MSGNLLNAFLWLDNERTPRVFAITLALVLVAIVASLIVRAYQSYQYQPLNTQATPRQVIEPERYQVQSITQPNLFGQLNAADEQQLNKLNLPRTRLQLILRGAFTSSRPALASAIIEVPGQKTRAFKVNSTVYGNAILHAVYRDRVVLSRSGQLETLYFPTPEHTSANSAGLSAQNQPATPISSDIVDLIKERATMSEIKQAATQLSSPTITAEQRQQLIRQRLQELRNRARK